jgi:LCP family protein required for cell wall assembly
MPDDRPDYKVYRSRPGFLSRFRRPGHLARLDRREPWDDPGATPPRPRRDVRRALRPGRLLRIAVLALVAWIALSGVVFLVSAQLQRRDSEALDRALSSGGSLLTGSTILVLGSDARPEELAEPGSGGAPRADSIMLMRASFGRVRRVSVLRDSFAAIPGDGSQKINAAYAIGGAPLAVETVEDFVGHGLGINHVIEVSFGDFAALIDAMGGIDVTLRRCISSDPFGGRRFRLRRGEHRLDGRQALAFARVRKNRCSPNEDDRARARRQQQVMSAIRARLLSPAGFIRLPWVSWQAPRTLRTDMGGPGLIGLTADVVTGGSGRIRVLEPSGPGPAGSLTVSEEAKARAARYLRGR